MKTIPTAYRRLSVEDERTKLSASVSELLHEFQLSRGNQDDRQNESDAVPDFHWDAPQDVRYARKISALDRALHVFQQDQQEIRLAVGSLPGRKLAVKSPHSLSESAVRNLARSIENMAPSHLVMHGMSDAMADLVEELADKGLQNTIFAVLHTPPTGWGAGDEARNAFKCFELARSGGIRRLNVMKAGFDFPESRLYRPMLFNLAPSLERSAQVDAGDCDGAKVMLPFQSGGCNKIYLGMLGAALSPRVKEVWADSGNLDIPPQIVSKVRVLRPRDREKIFDLIEASTLVLDVSRADSSSMAQMEAQALGRACLRGPLFLDALEDHPYVALTTVADASSLLGIRTALERLLDCNPLERRDLTLDYQAASDRLAIARYCEFLEI